MNPLLALALVSGGLSLISGVAAGKEARRKANQAAYDQKIERKNAEIQALAEHNARIKEYEDIMDVSVAWLGALGNRGYDASAKASFKASSEALATDTSRLGYASLTKDYMMRAREKEIERSGKYEQFASITTGFNNAIQMAYQYKRTS
tara:strand:+ start:305 stop:751 length:447 start_codon:yes stop_codon:yes gene_type:complete